MNDRVVGIEEISKKDRSSLNVGFRIKNKKIFIVVIFLFAASAVLFFGLYLTIKNINKSSENKETVISENVIVDEKDSALNDSKNFFDRLRKEKEKKDLLEKEQEENDLKLQLEQEAIEDKRIISELSVEDNAINESHNEIIHRSNFSSESVQPIPTHINSDTEEAKVLSPFERKLQGSPSLSTSKSLQNESIDKNIYSKAFNAYSFENGTAKIRNKNSLDYLLIHGTNLPCALYTQIISDYEGYVTCRITQDIYSANGSTLLIEKGSLVNGTQSVALEQGKGRIFTTWNEVETPLGITIKIDSLGTGQLGEAGIDAWVDNHFKERFGGAILLSFIDDALDALKSSASDNSSTSIDNSTTNASDLASKALDASINIKPTGYAYIGQKINILVVRDIDLSNVYNLRSLVNNE